MSKTWLNGLPKFYYIVQTQFFSCLIQFGLDTSKSIQIILDVFKIFSFILIGLESIWLAWFVFIQLKLIRLDLSGCVMRCHVFMMNYSSRLDWKWKHDVDTSFSYLTLYTFPQKDTHTHTPWFLFNGLRHTNISIYLYIKTGIYIRFNDRTPAAFVAFCSKAITI